jgi:uncharacterized protein YjiS (DUF1127 family)
MRTNAECTVEISPSHIAPVAPKRFWAHFLTITHRFARAISNRIAINKLTGMDERMLKDIGLTQYDVQLALGASIGDDPSQELIRSAVANAKMRFQRSP